MALVEDLRAEVRATHAIWEEEQKTPSKHTRATAIQDAVRIWNDIEGEMRKCARAGCYNIRFERYIPKEQEDRIYAVIRDCLKDAKLCHRLAVYYPEPNEEDPAKRGKLVVEANWQPRGFCITCGDVHGPHDNGSSHRPRHQQS